MGDEDRVNLGEHVDEGPEAWLNSVVATVDEDRVTVEGKVGAVALARREYVEQRLAYA